MKDKNKTTISFVMPCYNDSDTIEKAVKSILDQDLPDIEIIVVNDGSTDNSQKVLNGLLEMDWIKVIELKENKGACVARNEGTKVATGKYLSFLPADAILYPGMARIWYEMLEEHPDFDFLYGGYRFVDEDGEPLPNSDMFFQAFDPYALEVTNYIDGSFPIRREAFWKYAKLMNQPDGLWDKNIKSLQDWDFWLSVVKNGGKGLYIPDIFFGTTMPHPGGLSFDSANNWLERTEAIKKKHNIPLRKLCVASLGAGWHARRIAQMLNADFKEMPSFKPHAYDAIYAIGFYPEFALQQDQMFLNNLYKPQEGRTAAKKVVHFVGSDIWQLYHVSLMNLKVYQNYFKNNVQKVLCEAEFTQNELRELGIDAEIVPIPPAKLYEVVPLPKEFTVACYQPAVNAAFYRPNEMIEIAKKMPDVKFKFFGNPTKVGKDPALPENIELCGYISDMEGFIKDCSAIMRFPVHDGLPISVLEFLLAGRYSVQSVPIQHTHFIPNLGVDSAVEALAYIKEHATEVNQVASDYWREELNHDKYKKRIQELAGYEPKSYWEERAVSWSKQAETMPVEEKEVKEFIEKIKPKSVLEIGMGDGRWLPKLKEWGVEDYQGIDISSNLIKAAQFRFPHLADKFSAVKVEDYQPKDKVDLVFSYTCLEHIKEEDFPKAVEALKRMGKKALIIEPTNFVSRYYCHSHDYRKYFKVLDFKTLKDKVIYLVDLEKDA